jgi:hypothetical protein
MGRGFELAVFDDRRRRRPGATAVWAASVASFALLSAGCYGGRLAAAAAPTGGRDTWKAACADARSQPMIPPNTQSQAAEHLRSARYRVSVANERVEADAASGEGGGSAGPPRIWSIDRIFGSGSDIGQSSLAFWAPMIRRGRLAADLRNRCAELIDAAAAYERRGLATQVEATVAGAQADTPARPPGRR